MNHLFRLALAFLLGMPIAASAQLFIMPNVLVSGELPNPNEVAIAIDITSPTTLVAGANLNWLYTSHDQGATWSIQNLTSSYGVWGDPLIISDLEGRIYYAHLSGDDPRELDWLDRIVVQVSTDGGATFNDGAWTGLNPFKDQDKEWLSCDYTQSPHHGNIYMSWTEFDLYGSTIPADSSRILFARTTDAGQSWSAPIVVSDKGGDCIDESNTVEGATTAVGLQGEIYISWSAPEGIFFDRSTDGGLTFGKDTLIATLTPGWYFDIEGVLRCNGFSMTVCDISNSPYRGNLYILFSDKRNGAANTDVFLLGSKDGGKTWDLPKRVNTDATQREQFFPAIAIDQSTGMLYVAYYDRRNTSGTFTEMYLSTSRDGGETFTDTMISDSPFEALKSTFMGDYMNIAAHDGHIYPIWTRIDSNKKTSIWMTHVVDSAAMVSVEQPDLQPNFRLYPNPVTSQLTIVAEHQPRSRITIHDALGREVAAVDQLVGTEKLATANWPNGVYYCTLTGDNERRSLPFIVSH